MSERYALCVLARGFTGLAAGALVFALTHAAEPAKAVRVGFVGVQSPSTALHGISAFREGLRELGYTEGENLLIEERWAEGLYDRLPALMAELVAQRVDVLVTYSTPGGIAAKNATSTIPIVDAVMSDPVRSGLAASLAHPGGNLTGLSMGFDKALAGKWLELLQETVPRLSTVVVIANPDTPIARDLTEDLKTVAPTRGLKLEFIAVLNRGSLDTTFQQIGRKAQAVLILPDPATTARRTQITTLAAKHRLAVMSFIRDFPDAGGLMSYGPDYAVMWRRAAEYVDKILKGAKPGDLPIEQPTKFELVVNLKTAKALGITIPESILLRADEVIR